MKATIKSNDFAAISTPIANWYTWCMVNAPTNVHGTTLLHAEVAKVSTKAVSVRLITTDDAGNFFATYITPASWWAKKAVKGQTYGNFSKTLIDRITSEQVDADYVADYINS
jgi:hypothetical protein